MLGSDLASENAHIQTLLYGIGALLAAAPLNNRDTLLDGSLSLLKRGCRIYLRYRLCHRSLLHLGLKSLKKRLYAGNSLGSLNRGLDAVAVDSHNRAAVDVPLTDLDAQRDSSHLPVIIFRARAQFSRINLHAETCGFNLLLKLFCRRNHGLGILLHDNRDDYDLNRRNLGRQDKTLVVAVDAYHRRNASLRDTVTGLMSEFSLAVLVLVA